VLVVGMAAVLSGGNSTSARPTKQFHLDARRPWFHSNYRPYVDRAGTLLCAPRVTKAAARTDGGQLSQPHDAAALTCTWIVFFVLPATTGAAYGGVAEQLISLRSMFANCLGPRENRRIWPCGRVWLKVAAEATSGWSGVVLRAG
jgi:hypothetical protein